MCAELAVSKCMAASWGPKHVGFTHASVLCRGFCLSVSMVVRKIHMPVCVSVCLCLSVCVLLDKML